MDHLTSGGNQQPPIAFRRTRKSFAQTQHTGRYCMSRQVKTHNASHVVRLTYLRSPTMILTRSRKSADIRRVHRHNRIEGLLNRPADYINAKHTYLPQTKCTMSGSFIIRSYTGHCVARATCSPVFLDPIILRSKYVSTEHVR